MGVPVYFRVPSKNHRHGADDVRGSPGELVLGRYRVEHPIARGGFGRVYLATQVALRREVAVKASNEADSDNPVARERFRREAVLIAGIAHPNVVTYHDFGIDDDGDLLLVMELLRGATLSEVVRRKRPVPLAVAVRWISQAASGLGEAHARGIVHRDVKPSNLFLAGPGTRHECVKVIDFGILRVAGGTSAGVQRLTKSDVFIGTPSYAAPEMLLGEPVDARSDQYALALVAYELIAGQRAFPPGGDDPVMDRVGSFRGDLEFRATGRAVPWCVTAALRRALSPRPADRFPTIGAFAAALAGPGRATGEAASDERTLAAGEGSPADPAESGTRVDVPTRIDRRRRGRKGWIAGAIALGMVVLGAGAWLRSGPPGSAPGADGGLPRVEGPAALPPAALPPAALPPAALPPAVTTEEVAPPIGSTLPDVTPTPVAPRARPARRPEVRKHLDAPEPAPSGGAATLTLNAKPWAEVVLDGKVLGTTPMDAVPVAPGRHEVVFRRTDLGLSSTQGITVKTGDTKVVKAVF